MSKSQIKMIESVFVIIIFMMILMIVIVFFSRFERTEAQFLRSERSLRDAVQMAQIFSSLPEVACSESNVIRENCIDLEKLETMNYLSHSDLLYYYDLFRYGTVTIKKIYPTTDSDYGKRWVIYNRTKEGSGYFTLAIPMSLYNPNPETLRRGERYFGLMEVTFYND